MDYSVISRPQSGIRYPKIISLDTEYSERSVRKADLLSISVGVSEDFTYILEDSKAVTPFIENAEVIFTWNGVVDSYILEKNGLPSIKPKMFDAMLAEHLIDERLPHGLGDFALREYQDNYKAEFWRKYERYQDAPKDEAYAYEMRDGVYTYRAGKRYFEALKDRWALVEHVHRLQYALFETETRGIRVNRRLIEDTKATMGPQIENLRSELYRDYKDYCQIWELKKWKDKIQKLSTDAGRAKCRKPDSFKFSDPQLQWLLYDQLEYPVIEKTKPKRVKGKKSKPGNPSTKTRVLRSLLEIKPGIEKIIEYKTLKSAYPTFVVGLLDRVQGSRVYPTFFVGGTETGRISSSDPNMQNMPSQGIFRNFILPEEGGLIIGADYEGIEVGVEANLTQDPNLLKIMLENASKHDLTAAAVGLPRKDAKTLNFLLQYGGGVWKIKTTFKVSEKDAQEIYDRYWMSYSGVKVFKEFVIKQLKANGYVTNVFGRTRHFDTPENEYEAASQERQAYSHMVQGPAGDMNNAATYLVAEALESKGMGKLMMPIHDEIVCSVNRNLVEESKLEIVRQMESVNSILGFKYPIKAKPYGGFEFWQKA